MEDGGVQAAGRDQHQLETEDRTRTELGGVAVNIRARSAPSARGRRAPREQVPGEGGDGNTAGQTEQAQVEHRRGADEQRDPRDVGDLTAGTARATGASRGRAPRPRATRASRTANASTQLDGLAADGDPLGPHLAGVGAIRIADDRGLRATLRSLAVRPRRSSVTAARGRRSTSCRSLQTQMPVWMLVPASRMTQSATIPCCCRSRSTVMGVARAAPRAGGTAPEKRSLECAWTSLPGPRVAGPEGSRGRRRLSAELVGELLDDRLGKRVGNHLDVPAAVRRAT